MNEKINVAENDDLEYFIDFRYDSDCNESDCEKNKVKLKISDDRVDDNDQESTNILVVNKLSEPDVFDDEKNVDDDDNLILLDRSIIARNDQIDAFIRNSFNSKTGIRAFICDHCDVSSFRLGNIRKHVRYVHLDERPFTCKLCLKRFNTRQTIANHLHSHFKLPLQQQQQPTITTSNEAKFTRETTTNLDTDGMSILKRLLLPSSSSSMLPLLSFSSATLSSNSGQLCSGRSSEPQRQPTQQQQVQTKRLRLKKQRAVFHFCNECDNIYTSIDSLSIHALRVHGKSDPYGCITCPKCDEKFTTKSSFVLHRIVHRK
ncbi:hypothetical protein B4U80_13645 [Leptotrombidium deliense]|uniref:C2H2-type domain-containing protein n=1 Tax=Leptotrombidium deliense TaxID=299467 RepID=A0A443SPY9_9ACAR|nr:hypothetical protein B4U80_13645 [Leptotrombidium deliense]